MASEYTFIVDKTCPICKQSTRIVKIRAKIPSVSIDEDFCTHYKNDFNPYFYHIWVCEHCGFAGDEKNFLGNIPKRHKDKIREVLAEKKIRFEFAEERSIPDAVASYRLASLFADLRDMSLFTRAGIELRIAWLYRFSGEKEKENEYMQRALELYERSRMTEHYPQGSMTEYDLIYLMAAVAFRLEDMENCKKYLNILWSYQDLRRNNYKVYEYTKKLLEKVRDIEEENKPQGRSEKKKTTKTVTKGKTKSKSVFGF